MLEKFEVKKRWTDETAFTAEIETTPDMARGWKLRLAVAWAIAASVPLESLNLDGVDFTGFVCPDGSSFVGSSFDGSRFSVGSRSYARLADAVSYARLLLGLPAHDPRIAGT